jgi:protein-disulfide isomerase
VKDRRDIASATTGVILLGMSAVVLSLPNSPVRQTVEKWWMSREQTSYVRGNWDGLTKEANLVGPGQRADVAVVEFVDYQCGYCRRFDDELADAAATGSELTIGMLQAPRPGDVRSQEAARVAVCSAEQGVFAPVHHALFGAMSEPTPPAWGAFAAAAGVPDTTALLECIESPGAAARVTRDSVIAEALRLRGTPTFALRGRGLHTGIVAVDSLTHWYASKDE